MLSLSPFNLALQLVEIGKADFPLCEAGLGVEMPGAFELQVIAAPLCRQVLRAGRAGGRQGQIFYPTSLTITSINLKTVC